MSTIDRMRVVLRANKFQQTEVLEPERCEQWSNESGDDTIHVEWDGGFFQHLETEETGKGVRELKAMFARM